MAQLKKENIAEIRTLLASAKHDIEQLGFDDVPEEMREHFQATVKKAGEDLHRVVMDVAEIEEAINPQPAEQAAEEAVELEADDI